MLKILTIVGARPQFIKAAVVSNELSKHTEIDEVILHTGQHYDENMSEIFFTQMNIKKPKYNLNIGGGSHGQNTGRMIEKIEEVINLESPNCVILYGDTDSTLAGAIAASKLKCKVVHIEAGLRSFNRNMPEEINRILSDHASDLLFTPTLNASKQLLTEGISEDKIIYVGDVMYDATISFKEIANNIKDDITYPKDYILLTLHRAENVDDDEKLQNIISAFNECGKEVIFPIHPRTSQKIEKLNIQLKSNIKTINPIGYLEMLKLEMNAKLIATDSGGVQKEAYFQQKACIVLREETEWIELVEIGANILTGSDKAKILEAISSIEFYINDYETSLYGTGDASKLIVQHIIKSLNRT